VKHVIIGAGAAGIAAASTIRKFKPSDEIVIVSADEAVHSRCMLHSFISGDRDEKRISFVDEDYFAKNNIRWIAGQTVEKIENGHVYFANTSESYDKLLIATGAESIELPLLRNAQNVYGLRHLSDAKKIRDHAQNVNNIVIIGAGLVGLDAAYALQAIGKKPTVVDLAQNILPLNLDEYAARMYQKKFEEAGCVFKLGSKVVDAEKSGVNVDALMLDSGEKLPCDMVIVAIGSRPAVGFLHGEFGTKCDYGVTVDKYLATEVANIYAAGDVAGLSGVWPNAVDQGEVAAKNMCGIPAIYDDKFAVKNTMNYYAIPTLSLGVITPEEGDNCKTRIYRGNYKKVILRGGKVVGVIMQGDIAHTGFWQQLIKSSIDVSKFESVFDLSFADFYGVADNGEYEWAV